MHALATIPGEKCGLDLLDALILSGGGDIDPARYGGGPHETLYNIDHERDACEFALLAAALERRLPVFAICRGMQILNVLLGGSLHEHLPDAYGERVPHRAPPREPIPHALRILPDTFLGALLQQEEIEAASWHHQGIKALGRGLNPAGYAPDGLLEACELPGYPWLVAVQWHPELTAATDPTQQSLFDALVNGVYHRIMVSMGVRGVLLSSPRGGGLAPRPEGRRRAWAGSRRRPRVVSSSWTGVWLAGSAARKRLLGTELPPPSLWSSLPSAGMVPGCGSESRRGAGRARGGRGSLRGEEDSP